MHSEQRQKQKNTSHELPKEEKQTSDTIGSWLPPTSTAAKRRRQAFEGKETGEERSMRHSQRAEARPDPPHTGDGQRGRPLDSDKENTSTAALICMSVRRMPSRHMHM